MLDGNSFATNYTFAAAIAGRMRREMPLLAFRCGEDDMRQIAAVALLGLARRYPGLEPSRPYLAVMLRNAVLVELRRERLILKGGGPEVVPLASDDRTEGPDQEEQYFRSEAITHLRRRIASLPARERRFITTYLSVLDSHDYDKEGVLEVVAGVMRMSTYAACRRLQKVRKCLRQSEFWRGGVMCTLR